MQTTCNTLAPPAPRTKAVFSEIRAVSSEPIEDVVSELFSDPAIAEELQDWLNGGHHELIPTSSGIPIVAMRRLLQPTG